MIKCIIMELIFIASAQSPMSYFILNLRSLTRNSQKCIRISERELSYLMIPYGQSLNLPKIQLISSQRRVLSLTLDNFQTINLFNTMDKITLIIYNNKMTVSDDKLNDFFNSYFLLNNQNSFEHFTPDRLNNEFFSTWGIEFKNYKSPTSNTPKSIRDYGFIKKYEVICSALPYVTSSRPEQIQTQRLLSIISQIYSCYLAFVKNGLWKAKQHQSYLQQFTLLYLHQIYTSSQTKAKRKLGSFDKFVLNTFYTLNLLKSCNKYVKNFANFLNASYSFGQLFLYICLKNVSVVNGIQQMVDSSTLKQIIKVFQAQDQHNVSFSVTKESIDLQQGKMSCINTFFLDPIGGCLVLTKIKMYKIMKICKIISTTFEKQDSGYVKWSQFLKKYFQIVEEGKQICFQHLVSAAVAKKTYQLSQKLLKDRDPSIREQFLQQAFSYVFQILEIVFAGDEPQIQDKKTLKNIESLRKHFEYMKNLSECNITIMSKFSKKILKNNYLLELYKKITEYSS